MSWQFPVVFLSILRLPVLLRGPREQTRFRRVEEAAVKSMAGLLRRALAALQRHQDSIRYRDFIGVADFSLPSRAPRFHLVKLRGWLRAVASGRPWKGFRPRSYGMA